ncbi:MAG TPA: histidine kinase [Actinomycetales bacterium]|nr:histidine kinase [Actinomycetales bacterium]
MKRADAEDGALAVGAVLVGQSDVWFPLLSAPNVVGPPALVAAAYAVCAASLTLRRRTPFAVLCVVVGVTTGMALVFGASEGAGSLLPALVALYSVAAHSRRRHALVAAGLSLAMVVVRELNNPDNTTWAETANAFAWNLSLAAAWLLGAYLRTRRLYTAELAGRAARAETEREEVALAAASRAAAEERARIARELHDVVAHGVSVMVVQADAAEEMLGRDPARTVAPLQNIQRTGREALTDLRRLLGVMQPPNDADLQPQPGLDRVETLLERVRAAGLSVELGVRGTPVRLAPGVDLAAYRIVQESLTNVLKHAGATHARVDLHYRPPHVHVEVRDDGRAALNGDAPSGGHGLVGMAERIALYGGDLQTGPSPGGGYLVRARLPLEAGA